MHTQNLKVGMEWSKFIDHSDDMNRICLYVIQNQMSYTMVIERCLNYSEYKFCFFGHTSLDYDSGDGCIQVVFLF